jgi:hypothetical protein
MFFFKKYDRQNHVWSLMTKYLRFLCRFTRWSIIFLEDKHTAPDYSDPWPRLARPSSFFLIRLFNHASCFLTHSKVCLSSRNMIDKTVWSFMTKYLRFLCKFTSWSCAVSRNRYGVEKTVDTHTILINAIKFYVCLQEIW